MEHLSRSSTLMRALLFTTHLGLALVLGWYLMALPFLFGLNTWGFFHSGLPVVVFPCTVAICFWILGKIPLFRSRKIRRQ